MRRSRLKKAGAAFLYHSALHFIMEMCYDKQKLSGCQIKFPLWEREKADRRKIFMKYTKETLIGEVLDSNEALGKYFMEMGMHCLGCPAARGESIEEACQVHDVNCDELLEKLNADTK